MCYLVKFFRNGLTKELTNFPKIDTHTDSKMIHIEIYNAPIDFKSFLGTSHGLVLYGKTICGRCGGVQKNAI